MGIHGRLQRFQSTPTCTVHAGMFAGSLLVGLHMAATHGITLGMMSSAIPAGTVPGLGRISGTAWSFTDLTLGQCIHKT